MAMADVLWGLYDQTWLYLSGQGYHCEGTSRLHTAGAMVNITHVNLLQLSTSFDYANQLQAIANASTDHVSLISYDQSFVDDVLGTNVTQRLVADLPWNAFHEAGVYNHGKNSHVNLQWHASDSEKLPRRYMPLATGLAAWITQSMSPSSIQRLMRSRITDTPMYQKRMVPLHITLLEHQPTAAKGRPLSSATKATSTITRS